MLLKRTLIVNAEKPVVVEDLMIAQRRQDLIGEFTEFCSGDELQELVEISDSLESSVLGTLLELLWIHVVGHIGARAFVAQ